MRRALPLFLLLGTAGCAAAPVMRVATPPPRDEMVVLLPGPDGKVGTLTVTHQGQAQTLDRPYASTRLRQEGRLEDGGRISPGQLKTTFGAALDAQPPRPVTFVVYFLENSDEFTPESKAEIAKMFREIGSHPAPEVIVVGHTDRVGSLAYNDALSLRRAERVRNDLVQMGVRADQVRAAGRGEREPLVPTEDEVAEPRNRRVTITVR
jgi:outer membrane protein OmpA-like peptidoglycan-associated protein